MEIKKAKLVIEAEIEGRESKLEFDLTEEETEKVVEMIENNKASGN